MDKLLESLNGLNWDVGLASLALLVLLWVVWKVRLIRRMLIRFGPVMASVIILLVWYSLLNRISQEQLPGKYFVYSHIAKQANNVVLGAHELMQNPKLPGSASINHVGFQKSDRGVWSISNVSATRRLALRYKQETSDENGKTLSFNSDRFFLSQGDQLIAGLKGGYSVLLSVRSASSTKLVLEAERQKISISFRDFQYVIEHSNPAELKRCAQTTEQNGEEPSPPGAFTTSRDLKSYATGYLPKSLTGVGRERTVALFGGALSCRNEQRKRWIGAIPDLPFASLALRHTPDAGFAFVSRGKASLFVRNGSLLTSLSAIKHPVKRMFDDKQFYLDSFVAGYTRYDVELEPEKQPLAAISITPNSDIQRVTNWPQPCSANSLADSLKLKVANTCADVEPASFFWSRDSLAPQTEEERQLLQELFATFALSLVCFGVWARYRKSKTAIYAARSWDTDWGRPSVQFFEILARVLIAAIGVTILFASLRYYGRETGDIPVPHAPWLALASWSLALLAGFTARGGAFSDGVLLVLWSLLMAMGHVGLTALSLEMEETRFYRFSNDANLGVMGCAGVLILASQVTPYSLNRLIYWLTVKVDKDMTGREVHKRVLLSRKIPFSFFALCFAIAGLLLAWWLFGTETGIAGILQPSELVKTIYAIILGVILTLTLDRVRSLNALDVSQLTRQQSTSLWDFFSFLIALVVAAAIGLFFLEYYIVAALFIVLLLGFLMFSNIFWRTFAVIILILASVILAPIIKSDMSPAIILSFSTLLTFFSVAIMHLLVIQSDRFVRFRSNQGSIRPIPTRPSPPSQSLSGRMRRLMRNQYEKRKTFLSQPIVWLIVVPLSILALMVWLMDYPLQDYAKSRTWLMENLGGKYDVPIKRVISWIEFNGVSNDAEKRVAIEFADTALQVDWSRKAIEAASCSYVDRLYPPTPGLQGLSLDNLWHHALNSANWLGKEIKAYFIPGLCSEIADAETARQIAKRIPAIQSDFIGTWLIAFYGRDGALLIVLAQCLIVGMLLLSGVFLMRWKPGQSLQRPTASAAAFSNIAFGVMLAMQWGISWANALGTIPVMGQPATFLSHGRSHTLFFGALIMVAAISVLRMRASFERSPMLFSRNPSARIPRIPLHVAIGSFLRRRAANRR